MPFLWLATTAYKPSSDIFSIPPKFTFAPTLDQFRHAFQIFDVREPCRNQPDDRGRFNGAVTGARRPRWLRAGALDPQAGARRRLFLHGGAHGSRRRGADPVLPGDARLHLLGSWVSVVIINCMLNSAFVSWMMFSYFRCLPKELEEAALTDGCGQFAAFYRVALPAVRSGVIASACSACCSPGTTFCIRCS